MLDWEDVTELSGFCEKGKRDLGRRIRVEAGGGREGGREGGRDRKRKKVEKGH